MNRYSVSKKKKKTLKDLKEHQRRKSCCHSCLRISDYTWHSQVSRMGKSNLLSECGLCIFNARKKWNARLIVSGYNLGTRQILMQGVSPRHTHPPSILYPSERQRSQAFLQCSRAERERHTESAFSSCTCNRGILLPQDRDFGYGAFLPLHFKDRNVKR